MKKMIKVRNSVAASKKKSTVDYRMPLADYHPNHDKHLCKMVELRNMKTAGKLAKNAQEQTKKILKEATQKLKRIR